MAPTFEQLFNVTTEQALEKKRLFAIELLKSPDSEYVAATRVFGTAANMCMYVSGHWVSDPDVLRFKAELLNENGPKEYLPKKEELAREVWKRMTTGSLMTEDFVKLAELYAKINGYIERPVAQTVVNTHVTQNRVMLVPTKGTDDEWEEKMRAQQFKLTNGNVVDVESRAS